MRMAMHMRMAIRMHAVKLVGFGGVAVLYHVYTSREYELHVSTITS